MNTLLLICCVAVLVWSYRLMIGKYCRHTHWTFFSRRCINCGMGYRHYLKLGNRRSSRTVDWDAPNPYAGISQYVMWQAIPEPPTSDYLYREIEFLSDDVPAAVRAKWEAMLNKRHPKER